MKKLFFLLFLWTCVIPLFSQNAAVTVITPNGGENWLIGCPNAIQWVSSTPVAVRIELFRNGTFYMTIANQVPASQNTFSWTPPYTVSPGSTFKVKVTCLTNTAGYDFSNANFSINRGSITVISPNGGEVWQCGTTHLILWNDNLCENVRIELWKNGTFYSLLTSSTPSTGSFPWAITNSIPSGNDYKIKIMSAAINTGSTNPVFDFSDNNFTIGPGSNCTVTVTLPNGGEAWAKGSTHIITWQYNVPYPVRIELWKGGVYNSLITASTPGNGSFYWAIPTTLPSGSDYKVKIIALSSNATSTCYDFSDNNFSILGSNSGALKVAELKTKIYPNPCNELLSINIENDFSSPVLIEIINITGKPVLNEKFDALSPGEDLKINTSSLMNGYYILVVKQNDEIFFRNSVIIKH